MSTRGISLAYEKQEPGKAFPTKAFDIVSEVLRRLRYASRQFAIPLQVSALTTDDTGASAAAETEADRDLSRMFVRNYHIPTAVSEVHLRSVASFEPDFSIPVHAEVLLDALEAHVDQDYRKALLYGTIAVEAFARRQLENAASLNLDRSDARHRVSSFPVAGGGRVSKDPISDLLLESDNFPRLLHEAPLYILGRSLLLEKPETYRDVRRLYSTRNKIAHVGTPPSDGKYFAATKEDSTAALSAVVDAVAWYGDAGPYIVWDGGFVSATDGTPAPF